MKWADLQPWNDLLVVLAALAISLLLLNFVDAAAGDISRCAILTALMALVIAMVERRHHPV